MDFRYLNGEKSYLNGEKIDGIYENEARMTKKNST